MKKLMITLMGALLLVGCAGSTDDDGIIEIGERLFVAQINEIMSNPDRFLGRTIRYEGMLWTVTHPVTEEEFSFVVRMTEGCCSPLEPVGFAINLSSLENAEQTPLNAWVEVVGILEQHEGEAFDILRLDVISITEMADRGSEFVNSSP